MNLDTFTGGIFDTNCFFLRDHGILIDAPQDAAAWTLVSRVLLNLDETINKY